MSKEGIGFPPKNKSNKKKNKKKKVMATPPSKMTSFVKEGEKPLEETLEGLEETNNIIVSKLKK